jgi:hypothetical protein
MGVRRVATLFHNSTDFSTTAVYRDTIRHTLDALGVRHSKRISDVAPVRVNGKELFQATLRTDATKLPPTASRADCVAQEQQYIEENVLPSLPSTFWKGEANA